MYQQKIETFSRNPIRKSTFMIIDAALKYLCHKEGKSEIHREGGKILIFGKK